MTTRVLRTEPYDVDCRRPGPWGNPFVTGVHGDRETVIRLHREKVLADSELQATIRRELTGKTLICQCHLFEDCHVDTYIEVCEGERPRRGRATEPGLF